MTSSVVRRAELIALALLLNTSAARSSHHRLKKMSLRDCRDGPHHRTRAGVRVKVHPTRFADRILFDKVTKRRVVPARTHQIQAHRIFASCSRVAIRHGEWRASPLRDRKWPTVGGVGRAPQRFA